MHQVIFGIEVEISWRCSRLDFGRAGGLSKQSISKCLSNCIPVGPYNTPAIPEKFGGLTSRSQSPALNVMIGDIDIFAVQVLASKNLDTLDHEYREA